MKLSLQMLIGSCLKKTIQRQFHQEIPLLDLINGDFDANRISDYGLLSIMPYEIVGSDMPKECQLQLSW